MITYCQFCIFNTATNDYSKELQFRSLQKLSQQTEKCSVFRNNRIELISPDEVVVGDILVLQVCNMVASSVIISINLFITVRLAI